MAAGLVAFNRGWNVAGAVLWALPFVKPHVALPLLPLAWYLWGWKRAAGILLVVGGLNVLGATFVGGTPKRTCGAWPVRRSDRFMAL